MSSGRYATIFPATPTFHNVSCSSIISIDVETISSPSLEVPPISAINSLLRTLFRDSRWAHILY